MPSILALDPGYGNTKVCVDCRTASIQSAAARPRSIGLAAIGIKTASQARKVTFDQYRFAVGPESWHWGDSISSRDYSALATPERRAMFYAVLSELLPPGEYSSDLLVIGLPVPLLQDQTQAEPIFSSLKAYKGEHAFQVSQVENSSKASYRLRIDRLKVLAQPVGAYADWLLDNELRPRKGGAQAEVAILDLGMNTLDLYVIQGGRVEPRFVGGGKVGVRRLLELLTGNGHQVEELDAELRAGRLRPAPTDVEAWLAEVLAVIERTWSNLRRFSAVVPTGGGSLVLGERLRLALIAKGAAVHWPENPITANVRGLWKWGSRVRSTRET